MMGNGAAVVPIDGTIYAPVSGKVTVAYTTKHAYGLKSDNGVGVLIHIRIDTVELKGKYFNSFVEQDQYIEQGSPLGNLDIEKIKKAGYDPTVIVVVTNTAAHESVNRVTAGKVDKDSKLITATARN
ncbi:phosphoenolpyruvate-dependent sugar phosphotransferase system eiiabc, sucrose specific [Liquorilactobacillus uvarum DSM 19971]|uniref:Phosphoenolpyruvate-dependent sugar phosphotransferase system eiiabc, sucrose specific n=1 Tax=Liquorilactobacillus uvarum DSM 19971 TaxID=1423812 RepID=A0A0R1PY83_9LACO|nr:phosphoenolpyruvate-dependent sugar phosphotransferase system eiiabc, sucrose specific [Liquorilactobacillus uvarum DSM 19971]